MAAAPLQPVSAPAPTPERAVLSQGARIVDTFIAPSKTFADLRRSAAWWAPFLLMVVVSTVFVYTAGQKIGFRKIMENQLQSQPKAQARLENLPAEQRELRLERGAKLTEIISYVFPAVTLLIWLIIATALFATFKLAAGADVSFKVSLAIVIYSALPLMLKTLLALLSVAAGISPDSFSFRNPVATNPGYFMNPVDNVFLYSMASALDIFMVWTLALTAIGFACISKVKRGTSFAIVFGWWVVFTLAGAALGAAFA
ncbi:MAG: YIP1 family protein [Candidatus Sulfotelmatobacter sp.]